MSKLISSVKNLSVSIEDDCVLLEQEGFGNDCQPILNRISLTVDQVSFLIEMLLKATDELEPELKGQRGFTPTFDWLIQGDNIVKVLQEAHSKAAKANGGRHANDRSHRPTPR